MFSSQLTNLAARERQRELLRAARHGLPDGGETPVTRVTLRYAVAADQPRLRHLAELDSGEPPQGAALVAEVDGRLRAALPLDGAAPIADPFHRGTELVELLRMRAAQLIGAGGVC
jgi:hypothetical protein